MVRVVNRVYKWLALPLGGGEVDVFCGEARVTWISWRTERPVCRLLCLTSRPNFSSFLPSCSGFLPLRLDCSFACTPPATMADLDASSRIFVKGLPPTFTEAEFRKHFGQNCIVTDAKIFPNRRIGYVGYKTPEDARKAVKYFNKTFIRMSRIGVELARPIQDAKNVQPSGSAPTARRSSVDQISSADNLKRKRSSDTKPEAEDPKLKEFLQVMKAKGKKKAWESDVVGDEPVLNQQEQDDIDVAVVDQAGQSDDEYEAIPKKTKRSKVEPNADQELDAPMVEPGAFTARRRRPTTDSRDRGCATTNRRFRCRLGKVTDQSTVGSIGRRRRGRSRHKKARR